MSLNKTRSFKTQLFVKSEEFDSYLRHLCSIYRNIYNFVIDAMTYYAESSQAISKHKIISYKKLMSIARKERRYLPAIKKVGINLFEHAVQSAHSAYKKQARKEGGDLLKGNVHYRRHSLYFHLNEDLIVHGRTITSKFLGEFEFCEDNYIPDNVLVHKICISFKNKKWWISCSLVNNENNERKEFMGEPIRIDFNRKGQLLVDGFNWGCLLDLEKYREVREIWKDATRRYKTKLKKANNVYNDTMKEVKEISEAARKVMSEMRKEHFNKLVKQLVALEPSEIMAPSDHSIEYNRGWSVSEAHKSNHVCMLFEKILNKFESLNVKIVRYEDGNEFHDVNRMQSKHKKDWNFYGADLRKNLMDLTDNF